MKMQFAASLPELLRQPLHQAKRSTNKLQQSSTSNLCGRPSAIVMLNETYSQVTLLSYSLKLLFEVTHKLLSLARGP